MANPSAEGSLRPHVEVYDTTLRDGSQREGISYTLEDKLRIAERLDNWGVAYIEGGWPGSNPKDLEFFERGREHAWKHAKLSAFGMTRRAGIEAAEDKNLQALIAAGTPACTVVGKTSTLHVTEVVRTTLEENLKMIEESVAFLVGQGREVIYDAEHFFDGYRESPDYAFETLRAAKRGGARVLVLCETNGGGLPWDVQKVVERVCAELSHPIGIHAHDDSGCGVANSLAAILGGARHVQGTINGFGERCGNANLSVIVPNLELKLGFRALEPGKLEEVTELSRFVADVANVTHDSHMAYVGKSAFAHKGGIHVAAMRRHTDSYQHISPEKVGNVMRVVVSELSGRGSVLSKAEELGVEIGEGADVETLNQIKEAEARGLSFESAEASVALLLLRKAAGYAPLFEVVDYEAQVGQRKGTETYAEGIVKVKVAGQMLHTVADGNGPVSALDAALRKALAPMYPAVEHMRLADYKVRILDGTDGTSATTRVLIDSRDDQGLWSTVGASANIIEASMQALVDSIEYGLIRSGVTEATGPASEKVSKTGARAG
ncbi:MAG TPA: citramalate synthase [Polyangiaceae bacterium]|nr:citramalate synthase [Polyangiaceae bacterium]